MGVSTYAYTIIGVELSFSSLYEIRKRVHTAHSFPEGAKYCPVCGVVTESKEEVPLFDEFNFILGKSDVVLVDRIYKAYIGEIYSFSSWQDSTSTFNSIPNIGEIKQRVKKDLSIIDWWEEDKFGIYTLLKYT